MDQDDHGRMALTLAEFSRRLDRSLKTNNKVTPPRVLQRLMPLRD
jgi:hypothetical protein